MAGLPAETQPGPGHGMGQHQCHVPDSSWALCPPSGHFAALHTELSTTAFHAAAVHYSNFLLRALPFLPSPEAQVLAGPTNTDIASLTSPAPGCGSQAELARLSGWKTFRLGPQNSLTTMFWAYCLQFQLLQQWSPVDKGISCAPYVTSTFPKNFSPLWILGRNFRKSLKIHYLFKNYQFASDFLQGICFAAYYLWDFWAPFANHLCNNSWILEKTSLPLVT